MKANGDGKVSHLVHQQEGSPSSPNMVNEAPTPKPNQVLILSNFIFHAKFSMNSFSSQNLMLTEIIQNFTSIG